MSHRLSLTLTVVALATCGSSAWSQAPLEPQTSAATSHAESNEQKLRLRLETTDDRYVRHTLAKLLYRQGDVV